MKTILVPIEDHDGVAAILEAALLLGRSFGSYIEGLLLNPSLNLFLTADAIGATIVSDIDIGQDPEKARELRARFEGFMTARGIPAAPPAAEGLSWGWHEGVFAGDDFVGSYGRVFDLTIVGRPARRGAGPRTSTLEAVLFESGRLS